MKKNRLYNEKEWMGWLKVYEKYRDDLASFLRVIPVVHIEVVIAAILVAKYFGKKYSFMGACPLCVIVDKQTSSIGKCFTISGNPCIGQEYCLEEIYLESRSVQCKAAIDVYEQAYRRWERAGGVQWRAV